MLVTIILLIAMLGIALYTVLARTLIRSAIGLAVTSVILTLLMYQLNAPLAAVFELSVCAGLITVVFISAISLTKRVTEEQEKEMEKDRSKRYWLLPALVVIGGVILYLVNIAITIPAPLESMKDVREVLWTDRLFDILGQILIILAGVFGVVVLLKEKQKTGGDNNHD